MGIVLNKSALTNLIALTATAVGFYMKIDWLLVTGLFALSGALTNWLAVHMLFEKVPGLYGSGIVQVKFEQFKIGIHNLIMEQFFTEEHLAKFISQQNSETGEDQIDLTGIVAETDLSPAFDSLVTTIQGSSFGGMLAMVGGVEALTPMREPFVENLKASIIEISQTETFQTKLRSELGSVQNYSGIKEKVDVVVTQRLDELTPKMVKDIIQEMIKTHLGWLVVWGGVFGGLIGFVAHTLGL